jgi:hypothetical protein
MVSQIASSLPSTEMKKILIALTLLAAMLPAVAPIKAYAQAGLYPFGGPIIWAYPCTCTASYLIYVGPPNPGVVLLNPTSLLFLNYIFMKPGTYVLGNAYTAPAPCLNPVCYGVCCPTGVGMPVQMMGTSL